jgi:hypothetical protein
LFTYFGASLAVFLAAARFLAAQRIESWWLAGLCAGLGPALISRTLTIVYYAFPGKTDAFYIVATTAPFALLAAYGLAGLRVIPFMLARARGAVARRGWIAPAGAFCVALVLGLIAASRRGRAFLASAYAAYHSRWSVDGPWWRESMTTWGAIALTAAVCVAVAIAFRKHSGLDGKSRPAATRWRVVVSATLGGACLFVLGTIFLLVLGRPVHEGDAVQYFKVATLMYERGTVAFYPLIPAVPDDGMWASSTHPLGYYGMLVWSFLINGSSAPDPAKMVTPMHLVFCIMAIGVLMAKWGWIAFLAATLLFVSTPAMFLQVVGLGIDPSRIFLLAITAAWLHAALRLDSWRAFLIAGAVAGLCINSHSLNGIVTPLILTTVILWSYKAPWRRRLAMLALTSLVALAVGGERYVLNIMQFGVPIYDKHVLYELVPELDYLRWKSAEAQVVDTWSRLTSSLFLGFKYWYSWGISFWVGLFGAVFLWRELWSDTSMRIALVSTGMVFAVLIAFFGFVSSSVIFAANYRYLLTAFPFVAMFAGAWLGHLLDPARTYS